MGLLYHAAPERAGLDLKNDCAYEGYGSIQFKAKNLENRALKGFLIMLPLEHQWMLASASHSYTLTPKTDFM